MRASFLTATLLLLSQSAFAENNPRLLTGYDADKATFAFARAVTENDDLFNALRLQPMLVKQVMEHRDIQDELAAQNITPADAMRLIAARAAGNEEAAKIKPQKQMKLSNAAAQKAAADIAALTKGKQREDTAADASDDLAKALIAMGALDENGQPILTVNEQATEEEAKRKAEEALAAAQKPAPIIELPPEEEEVLIDVNAVPQAGLDERGWPKHLNVPTHCPAADSTRTYLHTFLAEKNGGSIGFGAYPGDTFTPNWIKSWFRTGGNWMHINMTDNETYAVPFITPNHAHYSSIDFLNEHGRPMVTEWSLSECPGQFDVPEQCHQTPTGMGKVAYYTQDSNLRAAPYYNHMCKLEPGKLYYVNVRTKDHLGCGGDENGDGAIFSDVHAASQNDPSLYIPKRRGKDGKMHSICVHTIAYGNHSSVLPPYTGRGVSQDPRPLNYFSGLGDMNKPYYDYMCNIGRNNPGMVGADFDMAYICSDPQDKIDAVTYHYQCRNNQGRWVGALKPTYSAYVCENLAITHNDYDAGVTITSAIEANLTNARADAVCARRREGQVKETRCQSASSTPRIEGYRQEQCQYVPEAKRYTWVSVGLNPGGTGLVSRAHHASCMTSITNLPERDTCEFQGQQYPIGTKRMITCDNRPTEQMISECRRVGEARHTDIAPLPTFAYVSGRANTNPDYDISRTCTYRFE